MVPAGPCEYLRAIDRSAVQLRNVSKKTCFLHFFFKVGEGAQESGGRRIRNNLMRIKWVQWDCALLRRN